MPVFIGVIMLAAYFVSLHWSKARYILATMNVELLVARALLIQSGALLWSVIIVLVNFFPTVQCEANPSLQCTSRPPSYFNSTGGSSKGIVNLKSAFEKADRLLG
jgi:hypothetical protein